MRPLYHKTEANEYERPSGRLSSNINGTKFVFSSCICIFSQFSFELKSVTVFVFFFLSC